MYCHFTVNAHNVIQGGFSTHLPPAVSHKAASKKAKKSLETTEWKLYFDSLLAAACLVMTPWGARRRRRNELSPQVLFPPPSVNATAGPSSVSGGPSPVQGGVGISNMNSDDGSGGSGRGERFMKCQICQTPTHLHPTTNGQLLCLHCFGAISSQLQPTLAQEAAGFASRLAVFPDEPSDNRRPVATVGLHSVCHSKDRAAGITYHATVPEGAAGIHTSDNSIKKMATASTSHDPTYTVHFGYGHVSFACLFLHNFSTQVYHGCMSYALAEHPHDYCILRGTDSSCHPRRMPTPLLWFSEL